MLLRRAIHRQLLQNQGLWTCFLLIYVISKLLNVFLLLKLIYIAEFNFDFNYKLILLQSCSLVEASLFHNYIVVCIFIVLFLCIILLNFYHVYLITVRYLLYNIFYIMNGFTCILGYIRGYFISSTCSITSSRSIVSSSRYTSFPSPWWM